MISQQNLKIINGASTSVATNWLLTSTGVAVDSQTITIGGVVFTTVTNLSVGPAVPGEVKIGASAAATLTNLTAALNAPSTTTTTFTALSTADANTIRNRLGITATTSATVMTMVSSTNQPIVVSETEDNFAWTVNYISSGISTNTFSKTSLQFIATGITSGNGVFTVDVSNDNTNWVAYNRLTTNVTNTNAQTDTRVASVTLSSNTSAVVTFPETDAFNFFRVKVVPTTDGSYSCVGFMI